MGSVAAFSTSPLVVDVHYSTYVFLDLQSQSFRIYRSLYVIKIICNKNINKALGYILAESKKMCHNRAGG
jgi:hypothetical protein